MHYKRVVPLAVCLLFFSGRVAAQLTDLCGIWIAKSYQCYTVGPGGVLTFYFKDEVVLITHNGSQTIATKLVGDDCVTSGQRTWEGNYSTNPFPVTVTAGSPASPGNSQVSGTIDVKDSTHLDFGSIKFTRLNCKQIDSLQIPLDSVNNSCSKCPVKSDLPEAVIPNVFTPNKDGINDYFLPKVKEMLTASELTIYNRWGTAVFKTTELHKSWDGQAPTGKCAEGVYFWIYTYTDDTQKTHALKGTVTLFN